MSDLVIADVSEFQGRINWRAYVAGGYPAAIIRAHNGYRADHDFAANRLNAHDAAIRALGLYQYLVATRDAAAQANELCDLVGPLRPGEWLVCDLEEGAGDQEARGHTWLKTVVARLHDAGTAEELYSGAYFLAAHNLSAAGFKRIWVASYGTAEPGIPHEEWQFTDARAFPGISGATDASLFHGTIEQLLAHIGTPIPPEDVVTPQDKKDIAALVLAELPGALAGLTGAVGKLPADVWNFELVRRGDDWKPAKVNPSAAAHWFVEGKDITDRQRAAEALELGAQVSALATQVEGLVGLVRSLLPPAAK